MRAINRDAALMEAVAQGRAWGFALDAIDPTGADDRFLLIRNSGKSSLQLYDFSINSTVTGFLEPQLVSVASLTGHTDETIAGTNLVSLSADGNKPEAEVYTGVDIVTLTTQAEYGHYQLAANVARVLDLYVRIRTGQYVAFNWSEATGVLSGFLRFYTVAPEDE